MATGKSGSLVWEFSSFAIRANWKETYNVDANTSNISITSLDLKSSSYITSYYPDGVVKINGTTVLTMRSTTPTGSCYVATKNEWYTISNTACSLSNIAHNADGTKSISIELTGNRFSEFSLFTSNGGYGNGAGVSSSKTITLTTIPRASSITSASNITLGNNCSVTWTPLSTAFYYKLKFVLGNWSHTTGALHPNKTSAYTYSSYTIPIEAVSKQIPNIATGIMTVYLYTYNNSSCSTQIGSTTFKVFTVTVPSSVIPKVTSVSMTIDNSANSVVKGWGIAVAGFSKVKITASADGIYNSTISSFTISGSYSATKTGTSLNYTGGALTSGSKTFSVTAKDSRGRTSSAVKSDPLQVYAYSNPTMSSFSVQRSTTNASKVIVKANWSFASVNGKNSTTAILSYKKKTVSAWKEYGEIGKNTSVTLTTDFDEAASYDFKITITDSLSNSATANASISTIGVLLDFKAGGKGLGIGKIAEKDNLLDVAFKSKFNDTATFRSINFIDSKDNEDSGIRVIDGDQYGIGLKISSNGLMVIGGGESATSFLESEEGKQLGGQNERTYLLSDTSIGILVNCNTIGDRKKLVLNASGNICPDVSGNFSFGISDLRFQNGYFNNIYNSSGAITTSDARLKTDLTELPDTEKFIMSLKPVQYKYINGTSNRNHWGFIAQEVKEVLDDMDIDCGLYIEDVKEEVQTKPLSEYSYDEKELGLRYEEVIPQIVAFVQKQQLEIKQLKESLNIV